MRSHSLLFRAFVCLAAAAFLPSISQGQGPDASGPPLLPSISRECGTASGIAMGIGVGATLLPNTEKALREHRSIRILSIGGPFVAGTDTDQTADAGWLQEAIQRAVKGLKVEIVNRGVSGELASDAAARLKVEVALNEPNLVIWEVGTADALAPIPIREFEDTLTQTIRWLKARGVDVALVGSKYSRQLEDDARYQEHRLSVATVADRENVMRISQWQAAEAMQTARGDSVIEHDDYELTEDSYGCVAQYVARAVVATLFAKGREPVAPASQ